MGSWRTLGSCSSVFFLAASSWRRVCCCVTTCFVDAMCLGLVGFGFLTSRDPLVAQSPLLSRSSKSSAGFFTKKICLRSARASPTPPHGANSRAKKRTYQRLNVPAPVRPRPEREEHTHIAQNQNQRRLIALTPL